MQVEHVQEEFSGQKKNDKRTNKYLQNIHIKLKIDEPHWKPGMNSGAPEG
jgi:hypothetical protein